MLVNYCISRDCVYRPLLGYVAMVITDNLLSYHGCLSHPVVVGELAASDSPDSLGWKILHNHHSLGCEEKGI